MYELEECISRYRRILARMEDDSGKIANGLQGDLLDAYRGVIERERSILEEALQAIQNSYIN